MQTPDQLADTAASLFGVERKAIFSQARSQRVVAARQALAWALRQRDWSLMDIGAYLHRDHTTIIFALKAVEWLKDHSGEYAEKLDALAPIAVLPPADWAERIAALERKVAELERRLTVEELGL